MALKFGKSILPEAISEFERIHSIKFPRTYVGIAKENDGASLSPSIVRVVDPTNGKQLAVGCDELIPFVSDGSYGSTMERANSGYIEGLPHNVIAFGREGSGILFAFDYRQDQSTDNPPIVCYFGEYDDDMAVFPAAADFDSFINSLLSDAEVYPSSNP